MRNVVLVHGISGSRSPGWGRVFSYLQVPGVRLIEFTWEPLAETRLRRVYRRCSYLVDILSDLCTLGDDDSILALASLIHDASSPRSPALVVSHSLGTILSLLAMDYLVAPHPAYLVTLGSPLPLLFRQPIGELRVTRPRNLHYWIDFCGLYDPVCLFGLRYIPGPDTRRWVLCGHDLAHYASRPTVRDTLIRLVRRRPRSRPARGLS